MSGDPWDDPGMQEYLRHAREELQPMIDKSTFVMSIAPEEGPDPKIAMETGYMMWLDKPLIVIASKGQTVPRNIRRVAHAIIYGHPSDPKVQAQLRRAMNRLGLGDAKS